MRMYDIIRRKRDGEELSDEEISFFVKGYTEGNIPDYQASALCMAIYFNGMSERETVTLTDRMARSGDMMDLSRFGELSADKHSTGGVGDKTTLIVAPVAAALGAKVTKMSGRGLGHTGGTVDKLESIPGFRVSLSPEEFASQIEKNGIAVIGQTGNLTPADKKLYALRDVTATVDSIPLITASVMSKKLAAGSKNIVLDVKFGSGAFMKTPEAAEELAENMVRIGKGCGRNIAAVLTNMNVPLGHAIGNSLEVKEAVEILRGEKEGDLKEVCIALASQLVSLVKKIPEDDAFTMVQKALSSGAAYAKMKEWIAAQGGDADCIEDTSKLPDARYKLPVVCPRDGYITSMDTEKIGIAAMLLGAGRASKEDKIDYAAGIILNKKTGDKVSRGDLLCTLHTNRETAADAAKKTFSEAICISDSRPADFPLIYKIIR